MSRNREIKQGTQYVGVTEEPYFRLTTTPWGSSPSSASVNVYEYDEDAGTFTEVTNTVMTGSVTVAGDVISLPQFSPPVDSEGNTYRFDVHFTVGGSPLTAYAWVVIER